MAMILKNSDVMIERMAYSQLRSMQAAIAGYLHFGVGDLAKYLECKAVHVIARRLTDYYFPKSRNLKIDQYVFDLYTLTP